MLDAIVTPFVAAVTALETAVSPEETLESMTWTIPADLWNVMAFVELVAEFFFYIVWIAVGAAVLVWVLRTLKNP